MSWIKRVSYAEATGKLKRIYDRIKGPDDYIDNILLVHSLRPNTLEGHMHVYKNILHHASNTFSNWFLEALGTYVSYLNDCQYCYLHHYEGMKRFLNDNKRAITIKNSIENDSLNTSFSEKELLVFEYAKKLTLTPSSMIENDIKNLKDKGYNDGELLEINQVISYFNYANRTVLGLGVTTEGDILGLSPNSKEDEKSWGHS